MVGDQYILDASVGHRFGFADFSAGNALGSSGELEMGNGRGFVRFGVWAQVFAGLAEVLCEFGDIVLECGQVDQEHRGIDFFAEHAGVFSGVGHSNVVFQGLVSLDLQ